ncbi:unnamed protein product [Cylindrotheca closterium]|uniref:DUF6824 domain-containing protein n=1 Tax=Cylindrotheca closterium TaxID=2856 RepID=A0AAD2FHL3_9STRA|nr:unnamed protein product [Cylindrotheca closterium]
MVTSASIKMLPYQERVKLRVHLGSHTECPYLLASYGITRGSLPLKGKETTATHQRNTSCHDTASGPNSANGNDVLCLAKRVKGVGNERLHSLALIYLSAYDNGSISNHRTIVAGIIDEVHRHGGRFLKPDPRAASETDLMPSEDEGKIIWMELSPDEQRVKVTQLFRNLRRRRSRPSANSASSAGLSSLTPSFISRPTEIVDQVSPNNVLFGPRLTHPGNRQL